MTHGRVLVFTGMKLVCAGMTLRLGNAGRIRPVVTAEANLTCDTFSICPQGDRCQLSARNTCLKRIGDRDGYAAGLGAAGRLSSTVMIQASGGVHQIWDRGRYVDAQLAWSPVSHFAFVVGARHIVGQDSLGDDIWFFARSFGIRLY